MCLAKAGQLLLYLVKEALNPENPSPMYDDAAGIYTALASHLEEAIGDNNYGGAFYSYGAATGGKTNTGVLAYAESATNNIGLKADVSATTTGVNYAIYADAGSLATNKAGHFIGDVTITGDLAVAGVLSSDLDTRIVNDSIRLNTVNGNVTGLDTRITNDSTRLNGIESDLDTRIVNDSTRLNSAITKAISDSTVLHSAMTDTASAIRADILWSEILTGINYSGTGRVGIGAATPGAKLDVRSGTLTTAITSVAATTSRNTGLSASAESAPGNTATSLVF